LARKTKQAIRVKLVGRNAATAYVALPGYPDKPIPGVVARTVNLDDLLPDFVGPRVHLDFNQDGRLIGIEILTYEKDRDLLI